MNGIQNSGCEAVRQALILKELDTLGVGIDELSDALDTLFIRTMPVRDTRPRDEKDAPLPDRASGSEIGNRLIEYSKSIRRLKDAVLAVRDELEI